MLFSTILTTAAMLIVTLAPAASKPVPESIDSILAEYGVQYKPLLLKDLDPNALLNDQKLNAKVVAGSAWKIDAGDLPELSARLGFSEPEELSIEKRDTSWCDAASPRLPTAQLTGIKTTFCTQAANYNIGYGTVFGMWMHYYFNPANNLWYHTSNQFGAVDTWWEIQLIANVAWNTTTCISAFNSLLNSCGNNTTLQFGGGIYQQTSPYKASIRPWQGHRV